MRFAILSNARHAQPRELIIAVIFQAAGQSRTFLLKNFSCFRQPRITTRLYGVRSAAYLS